MSHRLHCLSLVRSPGDRHVASAEAKVWLILKRARDVEVAVQEKLRLDPVLPVIAQLAGVVVSLSI